MSWACPQCGHRAEGTTMAPRCVRHFPGVDMVPDDGRFATPRVPLIPPPAARLTDPETSHAAAQSVTDLTEKQSAVLQAFKDYGPRTDVGLVAVYGRMCEEKGWPQQSESGLRTRRHELTNVGLVVDTGEKVRLPSGRWAIVWRAP